MAGADVEAVSTRPARFRALGAGRRRAKGPGLGGCWSRPRPSLSRSPRCSTAATPATPWSTGCTTRTPADYPQASSAQAQAPLIRDLLRLHRGDIVKLDGRRHHGHRPERPRPDPEVAARDPRPGRGGALHPGAQARRSHPATPSRASAGSRPRTPFRRPDRGAHRPLRVPAGRRKGPASRGRRRLPVQLSAPVNSYGPSRHRADEVSDGAACLRLGSGRRTPSRTSCGCVLRRCSRTDRAACRNAGGGEVVG